MNDSRKGSPLRLVAEGALVVLAYLALALLLLHPLFADPARQVFDPSGRPDGWLTAPVANWAMWVLAWDWHALTSVPSRLFEANIFHPTRQALATSQPMLGQLPLFAPVYAATGNMVLAYQLNLLLAIGLCGAAVYALLRHWGVARPAAFVAGFIYAFCPIRMASITHIHLLAGQYFPLVLLFLDKTLSTGRARFALAFLAVLALQFLCSEELAFLSFVALVGYGAGVVWYTRGRLSPRGVTLVLVCVAIASAVAYGVRLPRVHLQQLGIIAEADWLSWARLDSSGWLRNYLYPPMALRWWGWKLAVGSSLYVGLIPFVLAVLALRGRRSDAAADASVGWGGSGSIGIVAVSYVMALGPEVEIAGISVPNMYRAATSLMPDFATVAMPARFGLFLMAGLAALAGLGLHGVFARRPQAGPLVAWGVAALLIGGTAVEYDLPFAGYPTRLVEAGVLTPPVYRALARLPRGAVLEVPAATCDLSDGELESRYTANSAAHWHLLVNGYGVRPPISRGTITALSESLPDARATSLLGRMTGLRYVVVHLSLLPHAERSRWLAPPGLKLVGFYGTDLLFEVESPGAADLLEAMQRRTVDESLLGTTLAPLPPEGKKAQLAVAAPLPDPLNAGLEFKVKVLVTNASQKNWPALAFDDRAGERVSITYRWEDDAGNITSGDSAAAPLPYDLEPGQSLVASVCVPAPSAPGSHRLVVGLAQRGEWFPDTTTAMPAKVVPLAF